MWLNPGDLRWPQEAAVLRHPVGQIVGRMATSSNKLPLCQLPSCLNSPLPHSLGEEIMELIVICLPWIINSTLGHFGQGNGTSSCAQGRLDLGCGISLNERCVSYQKKEWWSGPNWCPMQKRNGGFSPDGHQLLCPIIAPPLITELGSCSNPDTYPSEVLEPGLRFLDRKCTLTKARHKLIWENWKISLFFKIRETSPLPQKPPCSPLSAGSSSSVAEADQGGRKIL